MKYLDVLEPTLGSLYQALISMLRSKASNAQISVRRLASIAGISQPHLNNALKGKRALSIQSCDRIIRALGLSVLDLMGASAHFRWNRLSMPDGERPVFVPFLDGALGPGLPLPTRLRPDLAFPLTRALASNLLQPAFVHLAYDPAMGRFFSANDFALIDTAPSVRLRLEPHGLYVVNLGGHGLVRWVLCSPSRRLLIFPGLRGNRLYTVSLEQVHPLDVVWARVCWVVRRLLNLPEPE